MYGGGNESKCCFCRMRLTLFVCQQCRQVCNKRLHSLVPLAIATASPTTVAMAALGSTFAGSTPAPLFLIPVGSHSYDEGET